MLSIQTYNDSDSENYESDDAIRNDIGKTNQNVTVGNVNNNCENVVDSQDSSKLIKTNNTCPDNVSTAQQMPLTDGVRPHDNSNAMESNIGMTVPIMKNSIVTIDDCSYGSPGGKKNTISNSYTNSVTTNYFHLSDSEDDVSDCEDSNKKLHDNSLETIKLASKSTDHKNSYNVDIPKSEFWKHATYDDVCEQTNIDRHKSSENTCSNQQINRKVQHAYETSASSGLYVAKRRRTNVLHNDRKDKQNFNEPDNSHDMKKSCFFIHHSIAPHLHRKTQNRIPKGELIRICAHSGTVNKICWCTDEFSHLLLSGSMDRSVKIWNVFSSQLQNECLKSFLNHEKAVKDVLWSHSGRQILSCGYDRTVRLSDVEKGNEIQCFTHSSYVTCIKYHPVNHNVFVSGANNSLTAWDQRIGTFKPVKQYHYKDKFGQVQDMVFTQDGNTLFICNDTVARDSADKSLMAWDFDRTVVLSNQIFQERYTCTRLKVHPHEAYFVAQTNGDYIAQFSTSRPYKMNKCKRYEGHKVAGYSIGCDFSSDGTLLASGSSDGSIYFYNNQTAKLLKKVSIENKGICMDIAWHPVLYSTIATSTWDGKISIWQ